MSENVTDLTVHMQAIRARARDYFDRGEETMVVDAVELVTLFDFFELASDTVERVRALADKWDNTKELDTGRRSIVAGAFAAALREALEGRNE